MAVKYTARADRDLLDCLIYGFESFGAAQADAYLEDLRRCFDMIARHPEIGRSRPGFHPRLRTHHHARHTIAYCIEPDANVLIVAVIRDGADLARHFPGIDLEAEG